MRAGVHVGRQERSISPDVDSDWSEAERREFAAMMVGALQAFVTKDAA